MGTSPSVSPDSMRTAVHARSARSSASTRRPACRRDPVSFSACRGFLGETVERVATEKGRLSVPFTYSEMLRCGFFVPSSFGPNGERLTKAYVTSVYARVLPATLAGRLAVRITGYACQCPAAQYGLQSLMLIFPVAAANGQFNPSNASLAPSCRRRRRQRRPRSGRTSGLPRQLRRPVTRGDDEEVQAAAAILDPARSTSAMATMKGRIRIRLRSARARGSSP